MISIGKRTPDVLGILRLLKLLSVSLMSSSLINMSSLEPKKDFVLLLLLIDATLLYLKLWVCFMVVLLQDQPVLVRLKP
jgi:hypothetical protein